MVSIVYEIVELISKENVCSLFYTKTRIDKVLKEIRNALKCIGEDTFPNWGNRKTLPFTVFFIFKITLSI